MSELIHTCYRIGDIDRSVEFYEALGFEERGRLPIRDEAINVFMGLPGDDPRLELTYNFGVDSYDLGTGYNHVVQPGDRLGDVVAGLASSIDVATNLQASGQGDTLVVNKTGGASFSIAATLPTGASARLTDLPASPTVPDLAGTSKAITLGGTTIAGDWILNVDGNEYKYAAQAADTPSKVALELAAKIDPVVGFTAGSEDATLVITKPGGGRFNLTTTVPSGATSFRVCCSRLLTRCTRLTWPWWTIPPSPLQVSREERARGPQGPLSLARDCSPHACHTCSKSARAAGLRGDHITPPEK